MPFDLPADIDLKREGRLVQKQMVRLAVIIKRRMWNIRGTAEGKKGGEMKCIKMRCAECLP